MRNRLQGFTLIELLVTMAILGVLLALGTSSFREWMTNLRVRTTAEAIQNGLQLARAEAVRRNVQMQFELTDTVAAGCTQSTSAANWVVSFDGAGALGLCGNALFDEAYPMTDTAHNPSPRILQVRVATEGSGNATISATQSVFVFNGLGRLVSTPATVDIENSNEGTCIASSGKIRCLRVAVTAGGQIRMCDPAYSSSGSDPQRCN